MKTIRAMTTAGMLLTGMLAGAADGNWQISGGLALPTGPNTTLMGNLGLQVSGARYFQTSGGYNFRTGLALGFFAGKSTTGVTADADAIMQSTGSVGPMSNSYLVAGSAVKHKVTQLQGYMDALIPWSEKTDVVFGLSVNKYSVSFSGGRAASGADTGVYSPIGIDKAVYSDNGSGGLQRSGNPNGTVSLPGVKLGLRLGVEHQVNKQFSARVLLQQTEGGRMISKPSYLETVNPFWVEAGVVYRF